MISMEFDGENAASLECRRCGEPFVWKRTKKGSLNCCPTSSHDYRLKCRKSCRCGWVKDEKDDAKIHSNSFEPDSYFALEEEWSQVMSIDLDQTNADHWVAAYESVYEKARYFWHRSMNWRMNQLIQKIFLNFGTLVMETWKGKSTADRHILRLALETGETFMNWSMKYSNKSPTRVNLIEYGNRLAQLYDISATLTGSNDDIESAEKWESYAMSITHQPSTAITV